MLGAPPHPCLSWDVQGTGLAPLMFSRHLEQIELRKRQEEIETFGETGLNDAFVIEVLSSMAPINESVARQARCSSGLKIVQIRKQTIVHISASIVILPQKLRGANIRQVTE
jgi:hypothetical protein